MPIGEENMVIKTFGSTSGNAMKVNRYSFCLKGVEGMNLYLKGYEVPVISAAVHGQLVDVANIQFPFLKDLMISNSTTNEDKKEIDLLIGADQYWNIVNGEVKRCGTTGLVAINSKLGWLLNGPIVTDRNNDSTVNMTSHVMKVSFEKNADRLLSEKIERFWDLDSVGVTENEQSVYDTFLENIEFQNGRYEVNLPFKEDHPVIEDNYLLSRNRLSKLVAKLKKEPEQLAEYNNVIMQQLELGMIENADNIPTTVGEVTYLPHRAVIRADKETTKLRVVLDASAKNRGPSLNDCLCKGPCLNPLLYNILLRFRCYNIALTADIEKAFLQIAIAPEHRNYLRFLWFDDIYSDNPNLVKYRFTRVIFGATCSQFLLNATQKTHAEQYAEKDQIL